MDFDQDCGSMVPAFDCQIGMTSSWIDRSSSYDLAVKSFLWLIGSSISKDLILRS